MENQNKETENTDYVSPTYPEKKTNIPYIALILSLVPLIFAGLSILTQGAVLFIAIIFFPIILIILATPFIGMMMGITFLCNREGSKRDKIVAATAAVLPALTLIFVFIYSSKATTAMTFSM